MLHIKIQFLEHNPFWEIIPCIASKSTYALLYDWCFGGLSFVNSVWVIVWCLISYQKLVTHTHVWSCPLSLCMHVLPSYRTNTRHQESKSYQDIARGGVVVQPSKIGWNPTIKILKIHNGKLPIHRRMRCLSLLILIYHHHYQTIEEYYLYCAFIPVVSLLNISL